MRILQEGVRRRTVIESYARYDYQKSGTARVYRISTSGIGQAQMQFTKSYTEQV